MIKKTSINFLLFFTFLFYSSCNLDDSVIVTIPPTLNVSLPSNNQQYDEGEDIVINFSVSDEDNDFEVARLYWDDEYLEYFLETGVHTFTKNSLLIPGNHTIKIEIEDEAENQDSKTINIVVNPASISLSITNITDITDQNALVTFNVLNNDFLEVMETGLCWAEQENPTIEDIHYSDTSAFGEFTYRIGFYRNLYDVDDYHVNGSIDPGKVYYIRPYVKIKYLGMFYGEVTSFKTPKIGWELLYEFSNSIYRISFINEYEGYVIDSAGDLYYTSDGGQSWTLKGDLQSYGHYFCGIGSQLLHFKSNLVGFVDKCKGDSILMTTDGGNSWHGVNLTTSPEYYDLYHNYTDAENTDQVIRFTDSNFGYTLGRITNSKSELIVTNDGGLNWNYKSVPFDYFMPYFYSSQIGIVHTGFIPQLMYKTTNGGSTWESVSAINNAGYSDPIIQGLKMFSPTKGVFQLSEIDGEKHFIFSTSDGWNSVQSFQLPTIYNLHNAYFFNENYGLIELLDGWYIYSNNELEYIGAGIHGDNFIQFNENKIITYYSGSTRQLYKTLNGGRLIYDW